MALALRVATSEVDEVAFFHILPDPSYTFLWRAIFLGNYVSFGFVFYFLFLFPCFFAFLLFFCFFLL